MIHSPRAATTATDDMHSSWLNESVAQELLPRAVVTPGELRDLMVAVLELFQIEATPVGEAGFTHPESVDDRDAPLIDTLLFLVYGRYPPIGSPAADAFTASAQDAESQDDEVPWDGCAGV